MNIVTNEVGDVKVGTTLLPGIYQSMQISGALRFDEMMMQGLSGTSKQPLGFEDAVVSLNMILPTNDSATCYDRMQVIAALFNNADSNGVPYVYKLINNLVSIWGIKQVLFKELKVKDDNEKKDSLLVEITFTEYVPVIVRRETRATPPGNLDPYTDFTKYDASTIQTKTGVVSPAKDDDNP